MNTTTTYSITQLRQNAAKIVSAVSRQQKPAIILQRSKPTAVIADLAYFQALEEAVLDLTDSQEAERAKKELSSAFRKYLKKRWGTDRL